MEATPKSEGAKPEGAPEGEDLSMEEILQSIRRIIAEEGDEPKDGKSAGSEDVPGSAVLELTEMVQDDGSVVSIKAETPPAKEVPKEPASGDVLSKIDQALASDKPKPAEPVAAAPAAPPPKPAEPPKPAPAAAKPPEPVAAAPAAPKPAEPKPAAPAAPAPAAAAPAPAADSLLSSTAANTAVASFNKLKVEEELPPVVTTPSPEFRSGNTVEDMVMTMLRPMMKEWLDANLPAIVERIVEREVKRLTK